MSETILFLCFFISCVIIVTFLRFSKYNSTIFRTVTKILHVTKVCFSYWLSSIFYSKEEEAIFISQPSATQQSSEPSATQQRSESSATQQISEPSATLSTVKKRPRMSAPSFGCQV